MRRRDLLAVGSTVAAGTLGGCAIPFTGGRDGNQGNGGDGGGETPVPTQPSYDDAVEFLEAELVHHDAGTFAETVELRGRAENTSDVTLQGLQIRVRFLSEDGEELGERATPPRNVDAGRVWSFQVSFSGTGSEANAVQDFQITAGEDFSAPTGDGSDSGDGGTPTETSA